MKTISLCTLMLCLALVASANASTLPGQTINVDFNWGNNPGATYIGLGADLTDFGTTWNGVVGPEPAGAPIPSNNLVDSIGGHTDVSLSTDHTGSYDDPVGTSPTSNDLLRDYIDTQVGSAVPSTTVKLSGLTPSATYTLYLYGAGNQTGQGTTFTVGGTSYITSGTTRSSYVVGDNYVTMTAASDSSGNLIFTFANNPTNQYGVCNGFQIQQAPAAAAFPDLEVVSITTTNNRSPQGNKITITATIKNNGSGDAGASTTNFYDGATLLDAVATPPIPAGASVQISTSNWRTAGQDGTHTIYVTADANDQVAESDEENNTSAKVVTIRGNQAR